MNADLLIQKELQDYSPSGCMPKLIVVSKKQAVEKIVPMLEAGHREFGENMVQEAASKWPDLRPKYPDIILHMIGPLQTNKVKKAVEIFDVIASIDRKKLALKLAEEMKAQQKWPKLFIQVNIGSEPQKAGVMPEDFEKLYHYCAEELNLKIEGLQCIPPMGQNPEPFFVALKDLAKKHKISKVSMGMSGDYKIAAKIGTDYVRVGTALFGQRKKSESD